MRRDKRTGLSMLEMLVVVSMVGGLSLVAMRLMDQVHTSLKSQKEIEMRAELFQVLQRVSTRIDCARTLASAPSGVGPITLYGRATGGPVLVEAQGSNFGRFSVIANHLASNEVQIRAASFQSPPSNPRSQLTSPSSAFTKKKIGDGVWSWATVDSLIASDFSMLATLCDPSTGTSTAAAPADFLCSGGYAIKGFSSGVPVCTAIASSTPSYTPPAQTYTPPAQTYTPPAQTGPIGGGNCSVYNQYNAPHPSCAGHCGGSGSCPSTWTFWGTGMPGGCSRGTSTYGSGGTSFTCVQ